MNHQHITATLNAAGLLPRVRTVAMRRDGYQVSEFGGVVAIHCGSYPVDLVTGALVAGGCEPYQRAGCDALFVEARNTEEGNK